VIRQQEVDIPRACSHFGAAFLILHTPVAGAVLPKIAGAVLPRIYGILTSAN
jgi:hypothetical protein